MSSRTRRKKLNACRLGQILAIHTNVSDERFRSSSDVSGVSGTLPVVCKRRETQVRSRRDGAGGRRLRQQASGASAGLKGQHSKLLLQRTVTTT